MGDNTGNYSLLDVENLVERMVVLENKLDGIDHEPLMSVIENSESSAWLFILISAFNIFLMQAGFALLEVGTVRAKNAKSILFKNSLDASISMMIWWLVGFGLAGNGASGQTGHNFFSITDQNTLCFIHSYVFAGTTATIVSGGVAERMNFSAYCLFSIIMVGLVYPVLVLWGWSSDGWLNVLGYKDFAGSGIIHLCGGIAALIGAILLGPRFGRFKQDEENGVVEIIDIKGHSPVLSNFGAFVLLFGWLSFNGSSILGGSLADMMIASRAVLNTFLSVSTCALTSFAWSFKKSWKGAVHVHNLEELNNSILAGAVAVTGGCAFYEGWAAVIVGVMAYFVYEKSVRFVMSLHIDDPLEASAVHGACGLWGVIAVGIFAHPDLVPHPGIVYGGCGRLFGIQILSALVIIVWSASVCIVSFRLIDLIPGFNLRVDKDSELLGLDFAYHDGFAYPGLNSEAISYHNEIKAAERRIEARNKGLKLERRKVKDLKNRGSNKGRKRKTVLINGKEMSISISDSANSQSIGSESAWSLTSSLKFKHIPYHVRRKKKGGIQSISVQASSNCGGSNKNQSENGDDNLPVSCRSSPAASMGKNDGSTKLDLTMIQEGQPHNQQESQRGISTDTQRGININNIY
mmetsp:Transcript_30946/g.40863  ORF Transcript_30946/g.40863 Transcript_30946/m.40863 type:complete len:633 (-) Transcript_30946:37-1935(-)